MEYTSTGIHGYIGWNEKKQAELCKIAGLRPRTVNGERCYSALEFQKLMAAGGWRLDLGDDRGFFRV